MKVTKAFELKIDDPCTENFDAMPRTNCGMFCGKCQKEVIDFTNLTDVELIDILKRKPDTCGVYRNDQLNKFYQYDEVITEKKPYRLWIGIMTFIALLGFRNVDAQVKGKHAQHKSTTATKHIPKNARIYCKYVDSDDRPLAHVKVTAGIEHTETDENGLFDIANPFTETTQMVAVNFEENGTYKYGQLRAKDVQDVVFVFKFGRSLLSGDVHPARLTKEDIMRSGGAIDISKVATTGGGGIMTNGRSNGITAAGGSRGTSTVTIIDGVIISDGQHIAPKKQSFFKRLFSRKAK